MSYKNLLPESEMEVDDQVKMLHKKYSSEINQVINMYKVYIFNEAMKGSYGGDTLIGLAGICFQMGYNAHKLEEKQ